MESVPVTDVPTAPNVGKHQGTHQTHGVLTPDQTPEPDTRRIEADIARRNAESPSAQAPQDPPVVEKPEDDNGENEKDTPPTEEQIEAVNRVMKCGRKEYRKILGVKDTYASQNEERQEVMDAFRELGCLVHIEYNNAENAEIAFNRVLEAAAKLGVNDDDITDMRNWDGKSKILNLRLNASGQQESSNSGQQETSNSDNMEIETEPELTPWHQEIYTNFHPLLEGLLHDPENSTIIKMLEGGNATIQQRNKATGLREDQFLIKYDVFIDNFKKAAPYRARLESHPDDEEAKRELKSINEGLRKFNREHHYPEEWVVAIPKPPSEQTATRTQGSEQTARQTRGGESKNRTPKFLTITERKGWVLDQGSEKEITGYVPAGFGHQLMLRKDGENDLDIYELVRASKFGKKFIKRNQEFLKGKKIRLGTAKSLEGKDINEVHIGGIAPVRRYPKNEPAGGWEREAKTLVYLSLDRRYIFEWYRRSTLGQEFGQEIVDEKLNRYYLQAGQESPLPATKKGTRETKRGTRDTKRGTREKRKNHAAIASDDEDEGSIPVEEDTSGEDDGEVEDSEDYEDDGNVDEDEAELQLLMEHLKQLKRRIKKKQEEPRNEGSAVSQKTKSKRSKAK